MAFSIKQQINVTIDYIGSQGDGVAKIDDYIIIVPKTAANDKVQCTIKYIKQNLIFASLDKIISPCSTRTKPPCKYYENCGGCNLQHISAEEYKDYKFKLLTDKLNTDNIQANKTSWISGEKHSRRRAFIRYNAKTQSLGFYQYQTHKVTNIENCLILDTKLNALLPHLKILSDNISSKHNIINGWMLTKTDAGIDIILESNVKTKNKNIINQELIKFAKNHNIARLSIRDGTEIINVINLNSPAILIDKYKLKLPLEYFLQASNLGQEAIINSIGSYIKNDSKILDLYSGVGIYSFSFADKASQICAYEICEKMIKNMEYNINNYQLNNKITTYCHDIDKYPLEIKQLSKFDTAIINPPRTGAAGQVNNCAIAKIPLVIIVSCNSKSFAKDAKILCSQGYKLISLYAIDQFYYSHHLEQIGVFTIE